jgi:hypothetical protein
LRVCPQVGQIVARIEESFSRRRFSSWAGS